MARETENQMQHDVIVFTGLGDNTFFLKLFTAHWHLFGLHPIVYPVGWNDSSKQFDEKLRAIQAKIVELTDLRHRVSLVGCSAGGSVAVDADSDHVSKIVNNCGRLRKGPLTGLRSFLAKTAQSPLFAKSIEYCESHPPTNPQKYLTIRPRFGDELVPVETVALVGAENRELFLTEHMLTILIALLWVIPHFLAD